MGEERWLGPEDQWPKHPKAHWRDLLKEARQAGWHLTMYSDHAWGRIVCDRDDPQACSIRINSSGVGGESFVLHSATPAVRRCKHRAVPLELAATRLLDTAERLLDAVEASLDAKGMRRRAKDLLEAAARGVSDADALFDAAVDLDQQADARDAAAKERLAEEGLAEDRPLADVVSEADRRVREARRKSQRPSAALRRRIEQLRERIAALRTRLG